MNRILAMSALAVLAGGYGHGRRLEISSEEEQPSERYTAADWGATPATTVTGGDLQRIADAEAKRARKAAKRLATKGSTHD